MPLRETTVCDFSNSISLSLFQGDCHHERCQEVVSFPDLGATRKGDGLLFLMYLSKRGNTNWRWEANDSALWSQRQSSFPKYGCYDRNLLVQVLLTHQTVFLSLFVGIRVVRKRYLQALTAATRVVDKLLFQAKLFIQDFSVIVSCLFVGVFLLQIWRFISALISDLKPDLFRYCFKIIFNIKRCN